MSLEFILKNYKYLILMKYISTSVNFSAENVWLGSIQKEKITVIL